MEKLILLSLIFNSHWIFGQMSGTSHPINPSIYSNSANAQEVKVTLNNDIELTEIFRVNSSISMTWKGVGPHGQLDVNVQGGTAPYKFYKNGTLIYTSYTSFVTLAFGCNGGVLRVEAMTSSGPSSVTDIITQGCYSGYN